jgi:hypothetical protein
MQLKAYVKLLEFLDMYNNLLNLSKHVAMEIYFTQARWHHIAYPNKAIEQHRSRHIFLISYKEASTSPWSQVATSYLLLEQGWGEHSRA